MVQSATQELAGELVKEVMMADADDANLLSTHYVFLDGTKPQSAPAPRQRFNEAAVPEGPYKGRPHAIPGDQSRIQPVALPGGLRYRGQCD